MNCGDLFEESKRLFYEGIEYLVWSLDRKGCAGAMDLLRTSETAMLAAIELFHEARIQADSNNYNQGAINRYSLALHRETGFVESAVFAPLSRALRSYGRDAALFWDAWPLQWLNVDGDVFQVGEV